MEVCPQNTTGDFFAGVKHVVVIVPVDADIDEAEYIAEKYRYKLCEPGQRWIMWHLHLEHHYRDNDRDNAIAKCLQSGFSQFGVLLILPLVAIPWVVGLEVARFVRTGFGIS